MPTYPCPNGCYNRGGEYTVYVLLDTLGDRCPICRRPVSQVDYKAYLDSIESKKQAAAEEAERVRRAKLLRQDQQAEEEWRSNTHSSEVEYRRAGRRSWYK
jgi:hypothetical protein